MPVDRPYSHVARKVPRGRRERWYWRERGGRFYAVLLRQVRP
jgi:hypothetical protein